MKRIASGLSAFLVCAASALAQSGTLDLDFATDGIFTSQIDTTSDEGKALAIQADGKIVTAGYFGISSFENTTGEDFYLRRFNADGSPDMDFGENGVALQDLSGGTDAAWAVEIQSDGKIIAAGFGWESWERALVMRFNADGTLDADFSGDGMAVIEIGGFSDRLWDIALQDDGKIVGCGTCFVSGSGEDWCAMRLNSNGTLDNSFGDSGVMTLDLGDLQVSAESLAILDDGRIIMGGYSHFEDTYLMQFAMLNANGSLDESWSEDGLVDVSLNNVDDAVKSISIQDDGKILGGGYSFNGNNYDFALVRLNADGTLDESFGDGGSIVTPIGTMNDFIESIYIKPDGQVVAGGRSFVDGSHFDFALAMFNPDGTLQVSFGDNGSAITPISSSEDFILETRPALDENILTVGSALNTTDDDEVYNLALVKFIDGLSLGVIDQSHSTELLIYPNPIDYCTRLRFNLTRSGAYCIDLYNTSGKAVTRLLTEEFFQKGPHEIELLFPDHLPSGTYILHIHSDSNTAEVMIHKN